MPPEPWIFVACECCMWLPLRWADHSSRGVVPSVSVSLCVITYNNNFLHLQRLGGKRLDYEINTFFFKSL